MQKERTVRSFDEALEKVTNGIQQMGGMARAQLAAAISLLDNPKAGDAQGIAEKDSQIDDFEAMVEQEVQRMLALRQPLADDLRTLLSCDHVATDLERIGDHARGIAQRAGKIREQNDGIDLSQTRALAGRVLAQLDTLLEAIADRDAAAARAVWGRDDEIDRLFEETFDAQLQGMCQTPTTAVSCTNALFIDKALERVGDHVTNIAEDLVYWVTGERLRRGQS